MLEYEVVRDQNGDIEQILIDDMELSQVLELIAAQTAESLGKTTLLEVTQLQYNLYISMLYDRVFRHCKEIIVSRSGDIKDDVAVFIIDRIFNQTIKYNKVFLVQFAVDPFAPNIDYSNNRLAKIGKAYNLKSLEGSLMDETRKNSIGLLAALNYRHGWSGTDRTEKTSISIENRTRSIIEISVNDEIDPPKL